LDIYQKYFGVPYPLPKLHIVALPEYHTGAMENWGAIASREGRVLINDESSFSEHTHAARTMTHEVGHMWFGDLVTMKWWDDLWLNESFATLMEYKILDKLHPEWNQWDEFLKTMTFSAMNLDALRTTHPVQVKVRTVEETTSIFDAISYNKGSSILRMLEAYVGEDAFRRGVSDYLKKFSYSNATGKDLWRALGEASNLPVTKVAKAWLTKPGFPMVRVSRTGRGIRLTQSQFRLSGPPSGTLWPIPLELRRDGRKESILMSGRSSTIPGGAGSELLLNPGRVGFYSVLYDEEGWDEVARNFSGLDPRDRAGVMNDLFLFMQAGVIEPELYFRFVSLAGETPDSLTAETTADQLHDLRAIADEAPIVQSAYQEFYPSLIRQIGEAPRPGEPETMGATREMLTREYAKVDPSYARKLSAKFEDYSHLDPNIREAVATAYAVTNGEAARRPLLNLVKSLDSEVDRSKIYAALSSFTDPRLVKDTLELVISGEVPRSDSAYPLMNGATNPHVRDAYWDWLTRRYDMLRNLYGNSQQFYLFMAICISYCGAGREAEVKRFLSGRRLKEGRSLYARTLEFVGIRSRLRDRLLAAGKKQD
jgi:tricorn protease interacting factor F2/3